MPGLRRRASRTTCGPSRYFIPGTNSIESINYQLCKVSKTRGHFPADDALIKVLYLACREMGRTTRAGQGGRSSYNWKAALNQFDLMFPGRLDRA
jgi:putative transposase